MAQRLDLQDLLVEILDSNHVYFQPPSDVEMVYPCIVYNLELMIPIWAENEPYNVANRYLVTVIDRDPDSEIPKRVSQLPLCIHDRFYVADNLNHHVFRLFF